MLPIKCPLDESKRNEYLRFINKDDLSYVDMRICRSGVQVFDVYWPLLKNADELSGNHSVFSATTPKEYHYIALLGNPQDIPLVGFMIKNGIRLYLTIDPDTNMILTKEEAK